MTSPFLKKHLYVNLFPAALGNFAIWSCWIITACIRHSDENKGALSRKARKSLLSGGSLNFKTSFNVSLDYAKSPYSYSVLITRKITENGESLSFSEIERERSWQKKWSLWGLKWIISIFTLSRWSYWLRGPIFHPNLQFLKKKIINVGNRKWSMKMDLNF